MLYIDFYGDNMPIKLTDWGIGSRINNDIYMNKNLLNYPVLFDAILTHERKHSYGLTWNDWITDLRNSELIGLKQEYYKFIIKHPRSWTEFLPFWFYERKLVINPIILILWGLILLLGGILGWILA
jgi:hypothetical protein